MNGLIKEWHSFSELFIDEKYFYFCYFSFLPRKENVLYILKFLTSAPHSPVRLLDRAKLALKRKAGWKINQKGAGMEQWQEPQMCQLNIGVCGGADANQVCTLAGRTTCLYNNSSAGTKTPKWLISLTNRHCASSPTRLLKSQNRGSVKEHSIAAKTWMPSPAPKPALNTHSLMFLQIFYHAVSYFLNTQHGSPSEWAFNIFLLYSETFLATEFMKIYKQEPQ